MNAALSALPAPTVLPSDAIQLLSNEGYQRLADALRDLLVALPSMAPTRPAGTPTSSGDGSILFTPFRPPPLDQGTWLDRARQVAIAHCHLRKEAPEPATTWLEGRCGLRFDDSQVERTGIALDAQIRSWRRRRLPRLHWLFIHTWRERVFQPLGSECWPVTLVVGIDVHGYRVAADLVFGPSGEPHWDDILRSLDTRGISLAAGGLTARMNEDLFEAARTRWPQATLQVCQRQFLSRLVSGQEDGAASKAPRLDSPWAEVLPQLEPLLAAHPTLRQWIRPPSTGQAGIFSTSYLPREMKGALGSLQWLEREVRNLRNKALQDDLPIGPAMKARLLTAATIEWEGTLDLRRPFLDPEMIAEAMAAARLTDVAPDRP